MAEEYWTISYGIAVHSHKCRECKKYIFKGQPIAVRDGRKLRFFYHPECFSGISDIRSQDAAMQNVRDKRYTKVIQEKAPDWKGAGKWSVNSYGYQPSQASTMKAGSTSPKKRKLDKKTQK